MDRDQGRGPGLGAARRPIAPFNPDPRWPQGYFQVLEELGVPERRRGFYAHWVRQFFNRCQGSRRRRDRGREDIERFVADLGRQAGAAGWQVAQAREALQVYYEQFRGIALDRPQVGSRPNDDATAPKPLNPVSRPPIAPAAPSADVSRRTAVSPRYAVREPAQEYVAAATVEPSITERLGKASSFKPRKSGGVIEEGRIRDEPRGSLAGASAAKPAARGPAPQTIEQPASVPVLPPLPQSAICGPSPMLPVHARPAQVSVRVDTSNRAQAPTGRTEIGCMWPNRR